ncbi:MAG TPA: large conductance mechanosensitive channel protein MscL, partial [Lactobacillus sp.]|nr:large conductance mechanosensitive channel protein MscL [Lactobacillus sp.]
KAAKEAAEEAAENAGPSQEELLAEIRDLLANK